MCMKKILILILLFFVIACDFEMDPEELVEYYNAELLSTDYCKVSKLEESVYPIYFNEEYLAEVKWSVAEIQVLTPVYVIYKSGEIIKVFSPKDNVFPREIRYNKQTGNLYIKTEGSILGFWDVQKIIQWNIPNKKKVNQYNY